jgi:hypothetical protein
VEVNPRIATEFEFGDALAIGIGFGLRARFTTHKPEPWKVMKQSTLLLRIDHPQTSLPQHASTCESIRINLHEKYGSHISPKGDFQQEYSRQSRIADE